MIAKEQNLISILHTFETLDQTVLLMFVTGYTSKTAGDRPGF